MSATKRSQIEEEEEHRLEQLLFGAKKRKTTTFQTRSDDEDEDEDEDDLGDLDDSQLFSIDGPMSDDDSEDGNESDSDGGSDDAFEMHAGEEGDNMDEGPEINDPGAIITLPDDIRDSSSPEPTKKGAAPLWHDPADDLASVSLAENKRLRKLGRGKTNADKIGGREFELRLREQFERLHPKPTWASLRTQGGTPAIHTLLSSTKSFISSTKTKSSPLPPTFIELQRLKNANFENPTTGKKQAAGAGGGVVDVAWHPSSRVGVMAVAGGDRRIRFFNIDGHTNSTLMTIHIPSLPLTKSTFHPSGTSILLAGTRPFYYTYDLASQKCLRSPRNLFGSNPSPTAPNSLTKHSFSPDGSLLAVAGRRGCVSVMEWSSAGGSGAVVAELKSGRGGAVQSMTWSRDGKKLNVLGGRDGSEVEVWDVGERKLTYKWQDDRAFGGLVMGQTLDESYTAVGSSTGIVNLYTGSSLQPTTKSTSSSLASFSPEPSRSLEHLTTPISTMAFHSSNQLLATASTAKKDALKLYHLPSGTAYSNWPTTSTPLGRVTNVSFNPGGEYMSVGNNRGLVLLWNVKHFTNAEST